MRRSVRSETVRRRCLVVGGLVLGALALYAPFEPEPFFQAYLYGFLPWLGLSLGALAVLMLQHIVTGEWGFVTRRILEAAAKNLPLMAILFLPIAAGLRYLYPWTDAAGVEDPELLADKSIYLNVPFFLSRAVLYFAVWIALALRLTRLSRRQDGGGRAYVRELQAVSAPGLILYGLTMTFAAIDWVMSLDYIWYSTIYGMFFISGQCLSALAFSAVVLYLVSDRAELEARLSPSHFHGLGSMLLAFVMLWAYVHFSQYLIIWSGNLPEDIRFYLDRSRGWLSILAVLVVFHFATPFFLLLSRSLKRGGATLAGIATLLLLLRFVDHYWLVAPSFHPAALHVDWMNVAAPVGIGILWLGIFARNLSSLPLLPLGDPRFPAHAPGSTSSTREAYSHGAG